MLEIDLLIDNLFTLWICHSSAFWFPWYQIRNCLILLQPSLVCDVSFFPAFKIHCGFYQFEYNVSRCGSLWVHPIWSLLNLFDVFIVFGKFWKLSAITFTILFLFLSPSSVLLELLLCICWYTWWYPMNLLGSVHFLSFFPFSISKTT